MLDGRDLSDFQALRWGTPSTRCFNRQQRQEVGSLKTHSTLTTTKSDGSTTINTSNIMFKSVGSSSGFGSAVALEEGPIILVGGEDQYSSSSTFTLSESEISSQWPDSATDSSSLWSYSDPTGGSSLPKVIKLSKKSPSRKPVNQPTSLPYAQLCFDPEFKTMVTLMEIDFSGMHRTRKSKRLSILDAQPRTNYMKPVDDIPTLMSNPSGMDSTLSTCSGSAFPDSPSEEDDHEPMVLLGTQDHLWLEEADLDLYLLHDKCCEDPWRNESTPGGCTESLRKLLLAYRSRLVTRQRASSWEPPRESFGGIGYRVLNNEMG